MRGLCIAAAVDVLLVPLCFAASNNVDRARNRACTADTTQALCSARECVTPTQSRANEMSIPHSQPCRLALVRSLTQASQSASRTITTTAAGSSGGRKLFETTKAEAHTINFAIDLPMKGAVDVASLFFSHSTSLATALCRVCLVLLLPPPLLLPSSTSPLLQRSNHLPPRLNTTARRRRHLLLAPTHYLY